MRDPNYWAIFVAVIAVFMASSIYYVLFAGQMRKAASAASGTKRSPWMALTELIRSFVLAFVVAHVLILTGTNGWFSSAMLGLWLWVGFPLILLSGSVLYEKVPWRLAAIHAGDWLVKLLLIAVILGVWT